MFDDSDSEQLSQLESIVRSLPDLEGICESSDEESDFTNQPSVFKDFVQDSKCDQNSRKRTHSAQKAIASGLFGLSRLYHSSRSGRFVS